MASLRTRLHGSRFRLGNAVGLLLVQDQAAANSNGGAIQRKSLQGLKDSFLSVLSAHVTKNSPTPKCPCQHRTRRESGPVLTRVFNTGTRPWHHLVSRPELASWSFVSQVGQTRSLSSLPTDQKQEKAKDAELIHSDEKVPGERKSVELEEAKKPVTIFQRFKAAYKEYGKVLICVHLATSAVWFGSFFYAAHAGVDIVPILKSLGFSDTLIKPFTMPGVGNAAVAYLLYKIATPVRYTVTIGGTQLAVRQLRRLDYMEPVPEGHSIRDLAKESASQMKTKYSDMKDDVRDRYSGLKEDVKDKYSDVKDDVKDKYTDLREDVKTKLDDWKTEQKNKLGDLKSNQADKNQRVSKK